jgi:hypothetical protein
VPAPDDDGESSAVAGVLSTPVYGERLCVLHAAPDGPLTELASAVARAQSAAGWRSTVAGPVVPARSLDGVDVLVLWGATAGGLRSTLSGRLPTTVVVFDRADVRAALTRPARWLAELRRAPHTNLVLVPAETAERYTRWGPPVPLAHRPDGLPDAAALTMLSAWIARAYAYGRRRDAAGESPAG